MPERYNIAVDVCDRHPRDKLAMIHEDFRGRIQEISWGELQDDSNRFANVLRAQWGGARRPRRDAAAGDAADSGRVLRVWKAGAILLSMSVLYGDEGIRHRVGDSRPKVLLTNAENAGRIDRSMVEHQLILDDELLGRGSTAFAPSTPPPTMRPSSTPRRARRAWRRASSTPTGTSSPTRSSSTVTTCATERCSTAWGNGRGRRESAR